MASYLILVACSALHDHAAISFASGSASSTGGLSTTVTSSGPGSSSSFSSATNTGNQGEQGWLRTQVATRGAAMVCACCGLAADAGVESNSDAATKQNI